MLHFIPCKRPKPERIGEPLARRAVVVVVAAAVAAAESGSRSGSGSPLSAPRWPGWEAC